MEQNKELWGIGWTRILTGVSLIGMILLIAIGKIPSVISMTEYATTVGIIIGLYTVKSVGNAYANKNNKEKIQ
jgi:hypothetical protein